MLNNFSILITIAFMLICQGTAYADKIIEHPPTETIVLKLSAQEYPNWKETYRLVNESSGIVQWVPSDQNAQKSSTLITIKFHNLDSKTSKEPGTVKELEEALNRAMASNKNRMEYIFNIIEKNQAELVYELIHLKPNMRPAPLKPLDSHQTKVRAIETATIVRAIETANGLHTVEVDRSNGRMSDEEKNKWIKTLKESASVASYYDAAKVTEGLSLVDKLKGTLNIGEPFSNWEPLCISHYESGAFRICLAPRSNRGLPITKCIELFTKPQQGHSIDEYFEWEKSKLEEIFSKKIKLCILKKTPTEIIFSISHRKNDLSMTMVFRSFISGQGYYCICYTQGAKLSKDELLQTKKLLETATICKSQ